MSVSKAVDRAFETINDMLIDRGLISTRTSINVNNEENDQGENDEEQNDNEDRLAGNIFHVNIMDRQGEGDVGSDEGSDEEEVVKTDAYTVTVIFYLKNKFQKSALVQYISNDMDDDEENHEHVIFVYKDKINAQNEKALKEIFKDVDNFEMFCLKNLLFNITRHSLVPKHELLTADEAEEIYSRYSVKTKQQQVKFPLLLTKSDPVAKYYDFKPGQLVRITRPSSSIGDAVSYRHCV